MDEQTGWLNDLLDRFETLFETFAQQQAAALQQQLDAFHVKNAHMTEAYFEAISKKEQNIPEKANTTLSLPSKEASPVVEGPLDASKDTILSSALNAAPLEVVFARPDDEECTSWQGDLFAIGGAAQVDTSNHNRSQPVNTFEWGSGSVRCNLAEPNILSTYGNDMGITNYALRLKDEAIKKLKERTQMSKKRLKIWDPEIKRIFKTSP
ncbi:hypothetical protein Tco_0145844 [Tanacetum coccineum]